MDITLEQIAEKVIGYYNAWEILTMEEIDRLGKGYNWGHHDYLQYVAGIKPCGKCGAYRLDDSCKICDEAKKVVKE